MLMKYFFFFKLVEFQFMSEKIPKCLLRFQCGTSTHFHFHIFNMYLYNLKAFSFPTSVEQLEYSLSKIRFQNINLEN